MTTRSPEHCAAISAGRRARGKANRARAVNGVTLADLHTRGAYITDAARAMGMTIKTVRSWEADTGKTFPRMPKAEANRRLSEALKAKGPDAYQHLMTQEAMDAAAARLKAIYDDPDARQALIEKRVAARKANPAAAEQSRQLLRSMDDKRRADVAAMLADPERRAAANEARRAAARRRFADPAEREKAGRRVVEACRKKRVEKGLAALKLGKLGEKGARKLIADMTAEERMLWMMERDAAAMRQRLKDEGMVDRPRRGVPAQIAAE